jgi:hypothetical protein
MSTLVVSATADAEGFATCDATATTDIDVATSKSACARVVATASKVRVVTTDARTTIAETGRASAVNTTGRTTTKVGATTDATNSLETRVRATIFGSRGHAKGFKTSGVDDDIGGLVSVLGKHSYVVRRV